MQGVLEERFSFQLFHFSACIYWRFGMGLCPSAKENPVAGAWIFMAEKCNSLYVYQHHFRCSKKNGTKLTPLQDAFIYFFFTYIWDQHK